MFLFGRYFHVLIAAIIICSVGSIYISNLSPVCMRCLCHAASLCNMTIGCINNYCGPFQLSRAYWRAADRYVLPEDDPNRDGAFLDCAKDYACAQKVVENYIIRHGGDCNGDGVTDCDDYAMLHFNLKDDCTTSLQLTNFGGRYATCRPTASLPETDDQNYRSTHGTSM